MILLCQYLKKFDLGALITKLVEALPELLKAGKLIDKLYIIIDVFKTAFI